MRWCACATWRPTPVSHSCGLPRLGERGRLDRVSAGIHSQVACEMTAVCDRSIVDPWSVVDLKGCSMRLLRTKLISVLSVLALAGAVGAAGPAQGVERATGMVTASTDPLKDYRED